MLFQLKSGTEHTKDLNVMIEKSLKYLESSVSFKITLDDEINAAIAKARNSFVKLSRNLWDDEYGVSGKAKISLLKPCILSTHLFVCGRFLSSLI